MDLLLAGIVVIIIIFLAWIIFNKKNNSPRNNYDGTDLNLSVILNENAKAYKQNPGIYDIQGLEFIDTSNIFDGCGKDFTYSNKLLKQLYGPLINDRILMHNKDDNMLYKNVWTSVNVCKGITQDDIDYYGKKEARLALH
jgi:hypothetical protein